MKNFNNFQQIYPNIKIQKALASFLGNAVGDALGAHTEFYDFNHLRNEIQPNWQSLYVWKHLSGHNNDIDMGLITDDTSMARCIADSLILNNGDFNPIDVRLRFVLWWYMGYCNGSQNGKSFGLGGNIAQSFQQLLIDGNKPYVLDLNSEKLGDINGNGSIMRLGTIPIAFHDNIEKAQKIAFLQSLTTHNGEEAAECCRLLTFLVVKLINYQGSNPKQDIFDKELQNFKSQNPAVQALANSKQEQNLEIYNKNYNKSIADRNWDWKNKELQVSPIRLSQQRGYFGSYCMDGAYVALHIAYHSENQQDAIFKAVNMAGDSDSIAAVVGYITGAMYGMNEQIWNLYTEQMVQHDEYTQLIKGIRLFNKDYIKNESINYNDQNLQGNNDFYINQYQKLF
ncbi:ADP-ribosylation/Crystallin J1 [Pseudocohnilembus persalinus]|uniref:ADP-ribosylation/Crystallin J1 n=1 Tax=Pseudocohnilembus persalinus TaxID=266149 RepID=A0A0V0QKE3_PSEPJ|nr:ADP-ribosylation/Crystallin J1 [Pseudocohnilembus persalinus]|eukprot:KRX02733.1 ADP-ribosylation/Crystallin J1 [Pseudocohnilembus persalinus]